MKSQVLPRYPVALVGLLIGCGNTIGLAPCDPFANDCSAEERCGAVFSFDSDDDVVDAGFFCVIDGSVAEGGLCRGVTTGDDDTGSELVTDDCQSGMFCATLGSERRCRALCDGDAFGCGGLEFCQGLSMNPFLAVCAPADNCDVIAQDCPSGEGCYATTSGDGGLLSHCFEFVPPPGDTGDVGSACEFTGDCVPGSDCFPDPADPSRLTCQRFCNPNASEPTCSSGLVCTPISTEVNAQTVLGLCE